MERLHALMRDADEENVFWIDDENDDDDFFVSALSISNPDLEETKQTPSFLRLHFELFDEVLLVEEEEAMRELEDDKANMMIENFTRCFFAVFPAKKKISNTTKFNHAEI